MAFSKQKLTWRSYTAAETLPATKQAELINKIKFAKTVLDENVKTCVIYITFFSLSLILIYLDKKSQIALLFIKEVIISTKYLDYLNVFLEENSLVILNLIKLNQHTIKLQDAKQLFYKQIYSIGLVELKILKTYIETNLFNSFIWSFKSSAGTFIFFV